jgi:H+/gluconate symporter-like permease
MYGKQTLRSIGVETILDIITRPETLIAIATIIAAVVPVIGLPVWATAIITGAATVAVPAIEQLNRDSTGAEKKAAAIKAVTSMVPVIVRVLPGTAKKIETAIEARVFDMNIP